MNQVAGRRDCAFGCIEQRNSKTDERTDGRTDMSQANHNMPHVARLPWPDAVNCSSSVDVTAEKNT